VILKDLDVILAKALEDNVFSNNEKQALGLVFDELAVDELNYLRNRAFAMSREHIAKGVDVMQVLKWLERVVKVVDGVGKVQQEELHEAYFSPGDDCRDRLIQLCRRAQHSLDVCVFTISDNHLSEEIRAAYKRGVAVRVITDDEKAEDRGSDIYHLMGAGVTVKTDNDSAHMHHKFVLRDNSILASGSFNWTRSATERNQENLIVTNQPRLVAQFAKQFEKLWQMYR
jgi:phosphatidylserine/phosphatidylglycerophosphate/cardiolipin synthase-like enzyme